MELGAYSVSDLNCSDTLGANEFQWQLLDEDKPKWDQLIAICPRSLIYHHRLWIELLARAYGLCFWLASINGGGEALAGCVFACGKSRFKPRFISLPFSDECAPLALNREVSDELLAALTLHSPPNATYEIRGVKAEWPWHTVECFANWTLELNRPLAVLERGLATNFRRSVKRASQGNIKIDRGQDLSYLSRFYRLQLESRRRHGLPAQPWRFFKLLHEIFSPSGSLEVWIAQENGCDQASAVFLIDGDAVHYKWGARSADRQSYANHLLFWKAIEHFAARGCMLDLGRTDVRNHGLMRFKQELGANLSPVPFSFYPHAPSQISAEVLTGKRRVAAEILRRMPILATRLLGEAAYRFFA